MTNRSLWLSFGAVVALTSGSAEAQEVRLSDDSGTSYEVAGDRVRSVRAHPEGAYMGVVPGSPNRPPRMWRRRRLARVVTWPGFQMTDAGSRVFIQLTQPVVVQEQQGVRSLTVTLRGARISVFNNRRPLVTTHFNTPVLRARLQQRRRDVLLVIELRDTVTPTITQGTGVDGYHFLFIDFPPGTYVAPPDPRARLTDDVARARGDMPDDGTRAGEEGMVDDEQIPARRRR
ncbi:MAG: hypothetical protein IT379_24425 [Deltaproteobacteria bacterium]|nr:hypothetical protein [Deltaproteobacteria bacterium]